MCFLFFCQIQFSSWSQTSRVNVSVSGPIGSERAQPLVEPDEVSPSEQERMERDAGWDVSVLHQVVRTFKTDTETDNEWYSIVKTCLNTFLNCLCLSSLSINDIPLFYASKKNSVGCIKKLLSFASTNIFERGEAERCPVVVSVFQPGSAVRDAAVLVSFRRSRGDGASCRRDERQPGGGRGSDGRSSWTHQRAHDLWALPRLILHTNTQTRDHVAGRLFAWFFK